MFGILAEPVITQRADTRTRSHRAGVTEYAPEGKAAEELRALWAWTDRKMKAAKA